MSVFVSLDLYVSLLLSTSSIDESAAAMKFIETDVKTVIYFSMDWAMQAGLAASYT